MCSTVGLHHQCYHAQVDSSCKYFALLAMLQVARAQDAVNDKLHMLEAHQKETHDSLLQMERAAMSMYQVCASLYFAHDACRFLLTI